MVERIRQRVRLPRGSELVLGIGDDCAIFRPRNSPEDLLFTTDLLLEDVHFKRETHSPEDTGHKAIARGLSDIAAMGGTPRFCLLSLALPQWAGQRWLDGFYRGFLRLAESSGAPLAGGDLARAGQLCCDVAVCGAVPRGTAIRRDGAKSGDYIYVSGLLGGSALGLETGRGRARTRHLRPAPRLQLGRFLREKLWCSACIDLSDGLSLDLHRLCLASGVSAYIEAPPCFPGATLEQALHGGEDYELLFTVRSNARVPSQFRGLPVTRLGRIHKGETGAVYLSGRPLPTKGYDHFRRQHAGAKYSR